MYYYWCIESQLPSFGGADMRKRSAGGASYNRLKSHKCKFLTSFCIVCLATTLAAVHPVLGGTSFRPVVAAADADLGSLLRSR